MTGTGNSVATLGDKDGQLSQIASLARRTNDVGEAREQIKGREKLLQPTIDAWMRTLRPLKMCEPQLNGYITRQVKMAFLPLGAKMRPDMADSKAETWASSFVAALSDLPAKCVIKALQRAMHEVFDYPAQLEAYVRKYAADDKDHEWRCIEFLRTLHRAIYGHQQTMQLTARAEPMTKAETRDVIRDISDPTLRKLLEGMGVGCGALDKDILDEVKREEGIVDDDQS